MIETPQRMFDDAPFDLFDEATGRIDPKIYVDPEIYERELATVFHESWLFVAHETQLRKPGDYFATYMGEDPVIVVRQKDHSVAVLLNQCRHRGMKVCRTDAGNARAFTCPYHGWAYETSGRLASVPMESDAFGAKLDKNAWGLRRVPRVEAYKGLIFACFNENVTPLIEYLGDMAFYLDAANDRYPGGMEVYGGVAKWVVHANWKLAAEQSCSDMYHGQTTHVSAVIAAMEGPGKVQPFEAPGKQYRSANDGHGSGFFLYDDYPRGEFYVALAGQRVSGFDPSRVEQLERNDMGLRAKFGIQHMLVFPNFAFFDGIPSLRVWHPRGPGELEFWSFGIVPVNASPEHKEQVRLAVSRGLGPAGTLEQDDGENWLEIQRVLRGFHARNTPFNAQMGKATVVKSDPDLPGTISHVYSEEAARGFYGRWKELMAGGGRGDGSARV